MALVVALWMGIGGAMFVIPLSARAAQTAPTRQSYSIAPGDLSAALDALGMQSRVQIVYAPNLVAGKKSRGASGRLTLPEALRQVLRGTGLTWTSVGSRRDPTFVLKRMEVANRNPHTQSGVRHAASRSARPGMRTLAPVEVSGSLIDNAQIQTATPTFTITRRQIESLGFDSVEQTLQNSVLSLGAVQGEDHSSSFTQGAQTFSLFGLPPGFSLVLIDGKPLASFGELYDGHATFHNISNLPSSMIARIDMMPGGASAIYGSSAMAGVVNIVTRSHMNGVEVSGEVKGYARGGRAERKLNVVFGHDFGKLDVLGSFAYTSRDPLWAYQRTLTSSTASSPAPPAVATAITEVFDYGPGPEPGPTQYLSPPDGCSALSAMYHGTVKQTSNAGEPERAGTYCGTYFEEGFRTLSAKTRRYDSLLKLKYDLDGNTRLYMDVMANYERKRYVASPPHWDTDHIPGVPHGRLWDAGLGRIVRFFKRFAPEELPGGMFGPARAYTQNNFITNVDVGANGSFGDSDWLWNAYVLHSADRTRYNKPLWLASVVNRFFESKFLGPRLGTDAATGLPIYRPDYAAFFRPVTPDQSRAMIYNNHGVAKAWINDARLVVNNPYWFDLPGGYAGIGMLLEVGGNAWYEPVDPNMANGLVWGHAATSGRGRRTHQAAAFEWNLPLATWFTADLSAREDRYKSDLAAAKKKFTYKVGLEWRPLHDLLVRGNYATSFKAPDMAGLFLGPSTSYKVVTDEYRCGLAGAPTCDAYLVEPLVTHRGDPGLKPTTARSWTAGIVWSPTEKLSFNVDYLHIDIDDQTILQSVDHLVHEEALCREGQLRADDPDCIAATTQVVRGARGNITNVTARYANLSKQVMNAITGGASYRLDTRRFGRFSLRLAYSDVLKHTKRDRPGSDVQDELRDPEHFDAFKSIVRGYVAWQPSRYLRTTLYWHRYGSIPNHAAQDHGWGRAGAGWLSAYDTYNLSLSYRVNAHVRLSLHVDRIFNKLPPLDRTDDSYPYYATDFYNIYGRSVSLNFHLKFGDA